MHSIAGVTHFPKERLTELLKQARETVERASMSGVTNESRRYYSDITSNIYSEIAALIKDVPETGLSQRGKNDFCNAVTKVVTSYQDQKRISRTFKKFLMDELRNAREVVRNFKLSKEGNGNKEQIQVVQVAETPEQTIAVAEALDQIEEVAPTAKKIDPPKYSKQELIDIGSEVALKHDLERRIQSITKPLSDTKKTAVYQIIAARFMFIDALRSELPEVCDQESILEFSELEQANFERFKGALKLSLDSSHRECAAIISLYEKAYEEYAQRIREFACGLLPRSADAVSPFTASSLTQGVWKDEIAQIIFLEIGSTVFHFKSPSKNTTKFVYKVPIKFRAKGQNLANKIMNIIKVGAEQMARYVSDALAAKDYPLCFAQADMHRVISLADMAISLYVPRGKGVFSTQEFETVHAEFTRAIERATARINSLLMKRVGSVTERSSQNVVSIQPHEGELDASSASSRLAVSNEFKDSSGIHDEASDTFLEERRSLEMERQEIALERNRLAETYQRILAQENVVSLERERVAAMLQEGQSTLEQQRSALALDRQALERERGAFELDQQAMEELMLDISAPKETPSISQESMDAHVQRVEELDARISQLMSMIEQNAIQMASILYERDALNAQRVQFEEEKNQLHVRADALEKRAQEMHVQQCLLEKREEEIAGFTIEWEKLVRARVELREEREALTQERDDLESLREELEILAEERHELQNDRVDNDASNIVEEDGQIEGPQREAIDAPKEQLLQDNGAAFLSDFQIEEKELRSSIIRIMNRLDQIREFVLDLYTAARGGGVIVGSLCDIQQLKLSLKKNFPAHNPDACIKLTQEYVSLVRQKKNLLIPFVCAFGVTETSLEEEHSHIAQIKKFLKQVNDETSVLIDDQWLTDDDFLDILENVGIANISV